MNDNGNFLFEILLQSKHFHFSLLLVQIYPEVLCEILYVSTQVSFTFKESFDRFALNPK